MSYTIEQRLSRLENRYNSMQQQLNQVTEAINQCVTLQQAQQLNILNGEEIAVLKNEVEALSKIVDALQQQLFIHG